MSSFFSSQGNLAFRIPVIEDYNIKSYVSKSIMIGEFVIDEIIDNQGLGKN